MIEKHIESRDVTQHQCNLIRNTGILNTAAYGYMHNSLRLTRIFSRTYSGIRHKIGETRIFS